jgi:hypothetical protein
MRIRLRSLPAAAALIAAASFLSPSAVFADTRHEVSARFDGQRAVTAELSDLRGKLVQLNTDAGRLESFTRGSRVSWESHALELNQIKAHVNAIGDQLATLESMRSLAEPSQQQAIDGVIPVAVQLAERTTAAINHLNENQSRLWVPEYVNHLRAISALTDHMYGTVSNYLKIVDAQNKIDQLDQTLHERVS